MKRIWNRMACILIAAIVSTGVLTGCLASGRDDDRSNRRDLVIVVAEEMTSFDATTSTLQSNHNIMLELYSTLFRNDARGRAQLEFAQTFEQDAYGATVTIPQNARFSDGSPITADDVVFSLNRARRSVASGGLLAAVTDVEAINSYTIRISTNGPLPVLRNVLAQAGTSIKSRDFVERVEAGQASWSDPVTSGRYRLRQRVLGDFVTIERNDYFWNPANAARNDSLTFRLVPEPSSRTIMVETGEADLNMNFSTADFNRVMNNPNLTLHQNTSSVTQYFAFDVTQPPFDNVLVRRAMNYAIDRDAVVAIAADGHGTPSFAVIPPTTLGHIPNAANFYYNPARARELLAEAGHPNGFHISISTFVDLDVRIAEVLQVYLAAVGITADINRVEAAVRNEMLAAHRIPALAARWGANTDPDMVLPRTLGRVGLGGANMTHFWLEELEELYALGRSFFTPEERIPFYEEAQRIIMYHSPWVPLYVQRSFALAHRDLQGVLVDNESARHLYLLHYAAN